MLQKRLTDFLVGGGVGSDAGRNSADGSSVQRSPLVPLEHDGETSADLMEQVVHPKNMSAAWRRVEQNKGAPGVDEMSLDAFPVFWERHGDSIRAKLLAEKYRPSPVRRVQIPKPSGGKRMLGIPTVLDRVIQQAILQVVQPIVDPTFSEHSYGFRPGRSAHDAVRAVESFVNAGYDWVVDIDLERFFDRIQHDVLMHRASLRIHDKRILRLIRRYLEAGMMVEGLRVVTEEGAPQGGPLSPILANILLDDLDRELERRGHRFARYADDCNIYVQSEAAGKRVFASIDSFLSKRLRLRINHEKSAVDRPWNRRFLGFTFMKTRDGLRLCVHKEATRRFRDRVRQLMNRRARGQSIEATVEGLNVFLRGWFGYFRIIRLPGNLRGLDGWVRRRLRAVIWRQWKRQRTRTIELRKRDALAPGQNAGSTGPWRAASSPPMHRAFPNLFFNQLGLVCLQDKWDNSLDIS